MDENLQELTTTELEALAYRLGQQRDKINGRMSQVKDELQRRMDSIAKDPDTVSSTTEGGHALKQHGKKLEGNK